MSKARLLKKIRASVDDRKVIELFLDQLKASLLAGDKVIIKGFGSFEIIQPKIRRFYNTQKKESLIGKPNPKISFKTSKEMVDAAKKITSNKLLN